jgi:hypothetical protein
VTFGATRGGNMYATEDQRPPFSQPVCVVADADPKH